MALAMLSTPPRIPPPEPPPLIAPIPLRTASRAMESSTDSATLRRSSNPNLPVRTARSRPLSIALPARSAPAAIGPSRPARMSATSLANPCVSARTETTSRSISSSIGKHLLEPFDIFGRQRRDAVVSAAFTQHRAPDGFHLGRGRAPELVGAPAQMPSGQPGKLYRYVAESFCHRTCTV